VKYLKSLPESLVVGLTSR